MRDVCTMSWFRTPGGYEVFFNRDERRSRRPALAPTLQTRGTTRFLAPRDGDFGGSWLSVNEHGLTLALENGYHSLDDRAHEPPGGFTSRGLLVNSLIDEESADRVLERLEGQDLHCFRSFLLTVFPADGTPRVASWTRGELTVQPDRGELSPLVSSSFGTEAVRRSRREVFRRMVAREATDRAALHLAYHASHEPQRGPYSTCMHRPEARTVSFSRVQVLPREVRFHYAGNPPCRGLPSDPPLVLLRRVGVGGAG
jgi:hypothetical protein